MPTRYIHSITDTAFFDFLRDFYVTEAPLLSAALLLSISVQLPNRVEQPAAANYPFQSLAAYGILSCSPCSLLQLSIPYAAKD